MEMPENKFIIKIGFVETSVLPHCLRMAILVFPLLMFNVFLQDMFAKFLATKHCYSEKNYFYKTLLFRKKSFLQKFAI
ncbi:hypothetical protein IEQ34_007063 [Dendrobium chrysotoxum]|uniref:Uncharacterized protein n=1 Tax=Dendrobium chrysotoxum TaxID=161865 RepID=A0AAV7H5Q9_DENCH|nr:hypothetical protein IEQ34_007063 [Dendrobium chrysotoxum]